MRLTRERPQSYRKWLNSLRSPRSVSDIQDLVHQHADTGLSYEQIKNKMIGWASNWIAASAAHMDVGNVNAQNLECTPCKPEGGDNWLDVNLMTGRCYNCGQTGHPARLCPNKGKGKGKGQSPGKRYGKSGGNKLGPHSP